MFNELKAKVLLNMIPEIGSIRANNLLTHFGSAAAVLESNINELQSVEDIGPGLAKKIIEGREKIDIEKELDCAKKSGVEIIVSDSQKYPPQLKVISDPPIVIYAWGKFVPDDIFSVAMVGTRKPTSYGLIVVEKLTREFSEMNVTVVSGLARGIDTKAHWTAIKSGGRTIAVLGNGLNRYYPPENSRLEKVIAENSGVVLSEFPMNVSPDRSNFPRRNRLIAALSLGTIVVEGDEKSGALITARCSVEQGKDVFAVPGSIFSKYSRGPHRLIKYGAKLVESAEDIVEEISVLAEQIKKGTKERKKSREELPLLNSLEKDILSDIEGQPEGMSIDKLQELTKRRFSELSEPLISLEMKGLIKSIPGKAYVKI